MSRPVVRRYKSRRKIRNKSKDKYIFSVSALKRHFANQASSQRGGYRL